MAEPRGLGARVAPPLLALLLAGAAGPAVLRAQGGAAPEEQEVETRHRLDFGFDRIGRHERKLTTYSFGYTWAPGLHHSLAVALTAADPKGLTFGVEGEGFALGDSRIGWSWAGRERVSARPWLPNRFGSGVELLVPTGNAERGFGGDMWVVTPYLGAVKVVKERFILLPTLIASQSFAEGDQAVPLRALGAEVGLLYEAGERWWLFYRPSVLHEFELSETVYSHLVQVGVEIGRRHGLSLEWGSVADEVSSLQAGFRTNVNHRLTVRAHLGFP